MSSELQLLYADTLGPNTTPQSVHEIRFERPCILRAFRIVCERERPHPERSFEGCTPPTELTLEMFGTNHGPGSGNLCTSLLSEPHVRKNLNNPSSIQILGEAAANTPVNYVVVRSTPVPLSLCLYGVEADAPTPTERPHWERLPAFGRLSQVLEANEELVLQESDESADTERHPHADLKA